MKTLKELREALQKALVDARAICAEAEKTERDFTPEERQKVTGFLTEAAELKKQIKPLEDDEALRKQIRDMGLGIDLLPNAGEAGRSAGPRVSPGRGKTLGGQFVEAPAFKAWLKQFPNDRIPDSAKGLHSPAVEFRDFGLFGRKELITAGDVTTGGAFVNPDITGIYEELPHIPTALSIRNLINVSTTGSDTVEFVRQTRIAAEAAPVPEANVTNYTGATGEVEGVKPEAMINWQKVTEPVKTIAVWVPATKRALSDAGQLRGLIDDDLRGDLSDEVEDQIVNGDGLGENFTGFLFTPNILVQPWDTDIFRTTRLAKLAVVVTGHFQPDAYVLNPEDWADIELTKNLAGDYYYGGPLQAGQKRLWGLPVVESYVMPQGQALVGQFGRATIWDREQATITVSDSHADFFIRNMIAILAEMRAAFGVRRPQAFCIIDMSSGS